MVGAHKFELGELSDYMIIDVCSHLCHGNFWDVITNPVKSASIYLPFNATVAALIIWNLKHLSKVFAMYPLSSANMSNNILYNITAMDVFAEYSKLVPPSYPVPPLLPQSTTYFKTLFILILKSHKQLLI